MLENEQLELIKLQVQHQCAATIAALMYNNSQDVNVDKAVEIAKQIVDKIYA